MKAAWLFIGLFLVFNAATAAPFFIFEASRYVPSKPRAAALKKVQEAFDFVATLPPHRNPLRWEGSPRDVYVVLTTMEDPTVRPILDFSEQTAGEEGADMDSLTVTAATGGSLRTFIFLFYDRIFIKPNGRKEPKSYARLVTALGHEIYGNLPIQLQVVLGDRPDDDPALRRREQISAFRASIAFLERVQSSADLSSLPKGSAEHFAFSLESERRKLNTWLLASMCEKHMPEDEMRLRPPPIL
jgi:hypothetical protein